jgi:8-oxo-dGTP diphosphatase
MSTVLQVVAGALLQGGEVLIAERPSGRHLAGRWEFPGGKIAAGETDAEALARELHEELGVRIHDPVHLMTLTHEYPDRSVELRLHVISRFEGEARGLDGQRLKWVPIADLGAEDILEADRPFIEALQQRHAAPAGSRARTGSRTRAGSSKLVVR